MMLKNNNKNLYFYFLNYMYMYYKIIKFVLIYFENEFLVIFNFLIFFIRMM